MIRHISFTLIALLPLARCNFQQNQIASEEVRQIKIIKNVHNDYPTLGEDEMAVIDGEDLMYLRRRQESESRQFATLPKADREKLYAQWKTEDVKIGMSGERVLKSCWGAPDNVKHGTTRIGLNGLDVPKETWFYKRGYLGFDNDVLVLINRPIAPGKSEKK